MSKNSWDKVVLDDLGEEKSKKKKPEPVLQDWVMELGLRLQGVLVSAIRGCDTAIRHDNSKVLARVYRSEILRSHAGDAKKSKSFILAATIPETVKMMTEYLNDCDHYPAHYIMHFLHASEILGYCHPDPERRDMWNSFYRVAAKKYHLMPESYAQLIQRLEKDEEEFHADQDTTVEAKLFNENEARVKKEKELPKATSARYYGHYGGS
jgi:hypothetical protein